MALPLSLTCLLWDYSKLTQPPTPPTPRQLAEQRESERWAKEFGEIAFRRMVRRWQRF
jgi:hypothetical protein